MSLGRWHLWIGGLSAILTTILLLLLFIDEPLRAYSERQLNQFVEGYQFRIGALDFHVIGLDLNVRDITIRQTDHPNLPFAHVDLWSATIHWKELIRGNIVSDHLFERPVLYLTKRQAEKDYYDHVPIKDTGWQQAVMAIYPVKINRLRIRDGSFLYRTSEDAIPLQFSHIDFTAADIRNVRSTGNPLPSQLHMEATIFDGGHLTMNGRADFLREPHMAVHGDISVDGTQLKELRPITQPQNIDVVDGVLSASGRITYAPEIHDLRIDALLIQNLKADLRYIKETATSAIHHATPRAETIQSQPHQSEKYGDPLKWTFHLDQGVVENGELGFINTSSHPPYRLIISDLTLSLNQWSNRQSDEISRLTMKGLFMRKGILEGDAAIRFTTEQPDFSLRLKLLRTPLKTINDFLRAHGSIDVVAGSMSLFSEMTVRHGHVDGYIKPLFKDVDVYDPNQDKDKSLWESFLEQLSDVAVDVLKNQPRKEVATQSALSGRISHPQANTWEIVWKLIQNAFFDAILPGLEGERADKKLYRAT